MNWFTKIFEKSDWRLVKELQVKYIHFQYRRTTPDKKINESEEEITYYLYEDQFDNRKFDVIDGLLGDIDIDSQEAKDSYTFRSETYRHTIRPWLDGRFTPEIPTYDSIPRRDFKKALKG